MQFNRIIAYGCSITSGMELGDTLTDTQKEKLGMVSYLKQLTDEDHKHSWPKYIADHFNVEYINRAVPGGNSQSSVYFLEQDLNSIITEHDLILIGHSEMTRWFWIDHDNKPNHGCMGGSDTRWPSKEFHKDFITYIGNKHLEHQFLHDIKYLDLLSKLLNGRILQQFCYDTVQVPFDSILDPNYSFNNLVDWKDRNDIHYFGHPKEHFHKIFAEHLIEKIKCK